ncbi:uncharacterized protein LOC105662280 [Megachile rotundata]|uniref:uncharacterized protein LOC105662280 n=1 Tax=Megachile rotundata TaxID=143995 RepID=UPI000614A189|nr:PREDICTED: uncharacterized protein LOC105662280 [Megachile rotundata]
MSHRNFHNSRESYVKEIQILEPEVSCEDHILKRTQSGRQFTEFRLKLRKSQSVGGSTKKLNRCSRKLTANGLKVPEVPEKIVNILNILQHENFLELVDQFFKPKATKQP